MIFCGESECDDLVVFALFAILVVLVIAAILASIFIVSMWYLVSTRLLRRGMAPLPRNALGVGSGAAPVLTAVLLLARSDVYVSDAVLASLVVLPFVVASIAVVEATRARRARRDRAESS